MLYDLTLTHPSRFIIYGPSGSGKTSLVEKLLFHMKELFGFYFDRIIYISGQSFVQFDQIHGIPIEKTTNINDIQLNEINPQLNNLIILDDNMHENANDLLISDLFTKLSHHKNITVIFLVQNLFPKSKYMRDISLNSTYLILMSNPREKLQIRTLSSQVDGSDSLFIYKAYLSATKNKPFSYLFLDFNQNTPDEIRVRSNIFPNEETISFVKLSEI